MQKGNRQTSIGRQSRIKSRKFPIFLLVSGAVILEIAFTFAFQEKAPSLAVEVSGIPSLKTDKETIDLGNVKLGTTAQVSYKISNVGDQLLRFSKAPYIELVEGC